MQHETVGEARYPIGAVARRTGLSPHVLRAWERRYGVVAPARSGGGERLYSSDDVLRLRLLRRVTESGHAIGRVAGLGTAALLALVDAEEPAAAVDRAGEAARYVAATLEAVEALDGPRIHATLMRAVVGLSSRDLVDGVIGPVLRRVGELWAEESICPVHERILSVNLRRVLAWMIEAVPAEAGAPMMVSTTPAEHRHELGAMLAGVVAAEEGWRVAYLGPDLPAEDIAGAVGVTGAAVVALSVVFDAGARTLRAEVARLRELIPAGVVVVAGGSGAMRHADALAGAGAVTLADLAELRTLLRRLRARRPEAERQSEAELREGVRPG